MAIDTAAKRRAFQSAAWAPQLPRPDGAFSSADKFSIQGITAFYAAVLVLTTFDSPTMESATVLRILDGAEAGEDADDAPSCFERFCGQGAETRDCPCNGWSRRHECAHFTADPQPESEDGE